MHPTHKHKHNHLAIENLTQAKLIGTLRNNGYEKRQLQKQEIKS